MSMFEVFTVRLVQKDTNVLVGLCFSLRQILMSVQRDSLSATTTPAALTCQGGTTVSAEAVSMTMGPTHSPGSPALVSSSQQHPAPGSLQGGDFFATQCNAITHWLNSSLLKFSSPTI